MFARKNTTAVVKSNLRIAHLLYGCAYAITNRKQSQLKRKFAYFDMLLPRAAAPVSTQLCLAYVAAP
ncbi:hypothetical protein SBA6_770009 [Candidatus Sulfopaludibacter sp. SbA6]|nr:hypothetical protein SBA6_770009 [Candidatus Sulfopaludibacter sp. SbA6]